jgi:hypothetical protein
MAKLTLHSFTLILQGVTCIDDETEEALRGVCNDALLHSYRDRVMLTFDRKATSFAVALSSAQADVKRAGYRSRWLLEED